MSLKVLLFHCFCLLIICSFSNHFVTGHVSLTFPPSRTFSLDFLNNFWTQPPCGMPKGTVKTSFISGSTVNITWHLGYAHTGGYKLELLNSQGVKITDLTPISDNNEYVQGKTTAQWHLTEFPSNITCSDCIIRLQRQVPEFSPLFAFWSCADVDIVPANLYVETCSGGGAGKFSPEAKRCTCCKKRWGSRCQYEDECSKDTDCGENGKCMNLGGSALPRNQCFCSERYFGHKCEKMNPNLMPNFIAPPDLTKYFKIPFGDRMTTYFKRILGSTEDDDVIEFVLQINGTSWAGLGWRPLRINPICKSWPFIPDALSLNKEPTLISEPSPPEELPTTTMDSTSVENDNNETSSVATAPEPQFVFIPSEWAAQDPFTPMDCSDIVMGAAIGNFSRVHDFYARGRHTPQLDTSWGGQNDLIGATGWESGNMTTLVFRRGVQTTDANNNGPDHPLKGELLLISARGQQPGEYVSNPDHHLEKGNPIISDFYTLDEYKYHGLGESQRGVTYLDFSASRNIVP